MPILRTLTLNLAARYEDYGSKGGSTFNPQARGKWQALPWFALRGSVGTTFRAPPQESIAPITTVTNVVVFNQSIPVETTGNPALTPEKSFSYSVGGIVEAGGFRASVDYWSYSLRDIPDAGAARQRARCGLSGRAAARASAMPRSLPVTSCSALGAIPQPSPA